MKTKLLVFYFSVFSGVLYAQLGVGDIAFSAYNADAPDDFTFVLLTNVNSGDAITFNENGWFNHLGGFRSGENTCTITFTNSYSPGVQIIIHNSPLEARDQNNTIAGTVTGSPLVLSSGGDSIIAYDASLPTPTISNESGLIAAINMTGQWGHPSGTGNDSSTTTELPTSLIDGMHAVSVTNSGGSEVDNARISGANCSNFSDIASLRTMLNTASNWETNNDTSYPHNPPLCNFLPILSVFDNSITNAITIYPNPTNGKFTIANPSAIALVSLTITDVNSRIITTINLKGVMGDIELNLKTILPSGIYFATIQSEQTAITKKLVVN